MRGRKSPKPQNYRGPGEPAALIKEKCAKPQKKKHERGGRLRRAADKIALTKMADQQFVAQTFCTLINRQQQDRENTIRPNCSPLIKITLPTDGGSENTSSGATALSRGRGSLHDEREKKNHHRHEM